MWEGEAQRKRIIEWNQSKVQLGPTIHQIRLSIVRVVQLGKLRREACQRSRYSSGDWRQTIEAIRLRADEGSSGVQTRE